MSYHTSAQIEQSKQLKGQGEEHDKRYFPLFSGERLKVYKLNLSQFLFVFFITHTMGTSSLFPSLILTSCSSLHHLTTKWH